jgi:hypothetical protein
MPTHLVRAGTDQATRNRLQYPIWWRTQEAEPDESLGEIKSTCKQPGPENCGKSPGLPKRVVSWAVVKTDSSESTLVDAQPHRSARTRPYVLSH